MKELVKVKIVYSQRNERTTYPVPSTIDGTYSSKYLLLHVKLNYSSLIIISNYTITLLCSTFTNLIYTPVNFTTKNLLSNLKTLILQNSTILFWKRILHHHHHLYPSNYHPPPFSSIQSSNVFVIY